MIIFCGYANVDVCVSLPVLPGPGDRVQAVEISDHLGGMGANAAVAAARLGAPVAFAGVLGSDAASDAFLTDLRAEGIDTGAVGRGGLLTRSVVLRTPDGERSVISQDDALSVAHIARVVADRNDRDAWWYFDGYRFPSVAPLLRHQPVAHCVVDLDGADTVEAVTAALEIADHVVLGRAKAEALLGDPGAVAAAARRFGTTIVVTDGAAGWVLHDGGAPVSGAALPVTASDTTGAGDCFVGAYIAELAHGGSSVEAARFAAVAAGLSCTSVGARQGLPSRWQVEQRTAASDPLTGLTGLTG